MQDSAKKAPTAAYNKSRLEMPLPDQMLAASVDELSDN